ncbi:epithelial membrane protein 2-like [Ptychodera flava]|uniref:epithelial membrane protein 2-like n=1 Tax=Ptychodera flava TaxID=63121 RepID=UPI00396A4152
MASNAWNVRGFLCGIMLSCAGVALCMIGTTTNHWREWETGSGHEGLWRNCTPNCTSIGIQHVAAYIHVARGCMITACVVAGGSALLLPAVLCGKLGKKWGMTSGSLLILTAVPILVGATWYGAETKGPYEFGYSIITAWVAVGVLAVGGVIILHTSERLTQREFLRLN